MSVLSELATPRTPEGSAQRRADWNVPHPDQSRRRARRMFLTPTNHGGVSADYSSPRPITAAYPQNVPHPDQSRRRTRRIFLTPTNHADVPAECSSPRPITRTCPQNIPHPDQSRRAAGANRAAANIDNK
eukprot:1189676-Prorocentrum_minimum.AAC.1